MQRTFILENDSEQFERPSVGGDSSLIIEDVPRQKVIDSLPSSLKDSGDSIAALKNTSRYADQSAAIESGEKAPKNNRFVPDPNRVAQLQL